VPRRAACTASTRLHYARHRTVWTRRLTR
jgi:hypothetical protein